MEDDDDFPLELPTVAAVSPAASGASAAGTHTVPPGIRAGRADKVLAVALPAHSRVGWQRALDAGLVLRAGRVLAKSDTVRVGDVITYTFPAVLPSELRAVAIPLHVVYEDEHLLAIDKAAGMVVHPGAGTGEDTLVHALLAHCAGGLSGVGGVERPGIVHRLDRETSGVMLVAKTDAAHRGLAAQFAQRELQKEYIALVRGVPALRSGVIDRGMARHPIQRLRMTVSDSGKPARTDWAVVETYPPVAALLRCRIHSGRTHQIRVHLRSIGHVVLGDGLYGWVQDARLPTAPTRVMLHAWRIAFSHPITARPMELIVPPPADFAQVQVGLRALAAS